MNVVSDSLWKFDLRSQKKFKIEILAHKKICKSREIDSSNKLKSIFGSERNYSNSSEKCFVALLGPLRVKAESKMLIKLTSRSRDT